MFTAEEAWDVVSQATGCSHGVSEATFTKDDIEAVFWYDYGCNCSSLSASRKAAEAEAAKKRATAVSEGLDDADVFGHTANATCGSYCDTWSEAYFRLKNGKYVVAYESSDTTGHGCQCSGGLDTFDTKDEFVKLGILESKRDEIERLIT